MTHDERVYYHQYVKPKIPAENADLIASLEELVQELLPYAGDSCPEECRYREECETEENLDSIGLPMFCVAYGHLVEKAEGLGVEVASDVRARAAQSRAGGGGGLIWGDR